MTSQGDILITPVMCLKFPSVTVSASAEKNLKMKMFINVTSHHCIEAPKLFGGSFVDQDSLDKAGLRNCTGIPMDLGTFRFSLDRSCKKCVVLDVVWSPVLTKWEYM
jgi:hypothetical protein